MFTTKLPSRALSNYTGTVHTELVLANWARNTIAGITGVLVLGLGVLGWWLASDVSKFSLGFWLGFWTTLIVGFLVTMIIVSHHVANLNTAKRFKWIGFGIALGALLVSLIALALIWFNVPLSWVPNWDLAWGALDVIIIAGVVIGSMILPWIASKHTIRS